MPVSPSRLARRSRPSSVVRIKSHHTHNPQHRLVVLCPFSNPSSRCIRPRLSPPLTVREPAPSAGQGTRHTYTRGTLSYIISSKRTDGREPKPDRAKDNIHQQGSRQSTAVVVQSKRCPGSPRSINQPVTSQSSKSLVHSSRSQDPEQRLRRGRPSQARSSSSGSSPKGAAGSKSFQQHLALILEQGRRARRFSNRSPSRCLPLALSNLAPGAYSNTHQIPYSILL